MNNKTNAKTSPFMSFFAGFALAAVIAAAAVFVYVIPKLESNHSQELQNKEASNQEEALRAKSDYTKTIEDAKKQISNSNKIRNNASQLLLEVAVIHETVAKSPDLVANAEVVSNILRGQAEILNPTLIKRPSPEEYAKHQKKLETLKLALDDLKKEVEMFANGK